MDPTLAQIQSANVESLRYFWPEIILTLGVLALFIADLLIKRSDKRVPALAGLALLFLLGSGVATLLLSGAAGKALFGGLLVHDSLAMFFKWFFLGATALAIWMAAPSSEIAPERMGEYFALLLAMCLGMNLMASSTDLLMVYLSLELVSLVSYVLAGYRRADRRASEASLKYVIYGGVASGIMVFGMSYIYGLLGTTDLSVLAQNLSRFNPAAGLPLSRAGGQLALVVAVVFVLSGIGYKVASVPWHMWCPDVYEGAPTPFTAFLSVGPKAAGFALALRFFFGAMASVGSDQPEQVARIAAGVPWPAILGAVAAATMTLGNFAAINQTNLKRLLAYSSIAHAGYITMGLASGTNLGNLAVLVYLTIYLFMNVGAFLVVLSVARAGGSESIFEYRGLAKRSPFAAIAFAIFLFSLTGLPPFAGFIGKFYLFAAVVVKARSAVGFDATGWWTLAIIGVLNSAVSLYYYARIVRAMFLEKPVQEKPVPIPLSYAGLLAGLAAAVLVFGVWWSPIYDAAQNAVRAMYWGV